MLTDNDDAIDKMALIYKSLFTFEIGIKLDQKSDVSVNKNKENI